MSGSLITQRHHQPHTPSRAARELGLKRSEFDLAVHLGQIRTVPDEGGGGRRVTRSEIDRLRATDGFPDSLLQRVRVVGTTEGAKVMDVPAGRFTRLARLGLFSPVRFYLNRYRAVVWLYLAEELEEFTAVEENTPLLTARRMPEGLRDMLDAGVDLRARNWRGRHRGFLLRLAEDPWESAGALAAFLDPVQIAELVPDPYERSHLGRFRPGPPAQGAQGSPAAHLIEKIMTADHPDEIEWLRTDLARALEDARRFRPAPRPTARRTASTQPQDSSTPQEEPTRGLLGRLRRRSS
ncbi:DUF6397 family protein [Streptomyces sp. SAI-127]|uniref:DUF6397 family protein n=1 Tax=Streptomyces sp. SAI-127 TaxID=2940543 RepID=UPI0024739941|nr:DUF6397 family protein [Streptomyces sp. SAI-127]MDH6492208.1 hypothetical protein [Streptomyces sp. SAI-127]